MNLPQNAEDVFDVALALPAAERVRLIDKLTASIEPTRSDLDDCLLRESLERIRAFEAGEMEAIDAEEVFKRLRKE